MSTLKYWDGSKWTPMVMGPGVEVYYQPDAPATSTIGAIWIDTDALPSTWALPPVAQVYAITAGYTKDRAMNPAATTLGEVATVLSTLIDDLKAAGIITP